MGLQEEASGESRVERKSLHAVYERVIVHWAIKNVVWSRLVIQLV